MPRLRKLAVFAGLVVSMLLAVAPGQAGEQLPPAKSPEEAVQNLMTAIRAGDAEQFLSQLGSPAFEALREEIAFEALERDWHKTFDAQFGKSRNPSPEHSFLDALREREIIQVVDKENRTDGKVILTVWTTDANRWRPPGLHRPYVLESKWLAVQECGAWKIALFAADTTGEKIIKKGPDGREAEVTVSEVNFDRAAAAFARMELYCRTVRAAVEKATEPFWQDMQAGKFKDRNAAEEALSAITTPVIRAIPLPVLDNADGKQKEK